MKFFVPSSSTSSSPRPSTIACQKKIWTSSGMLRKNSMYALATRDTIQFDESRAMPMIVPMIVAAMTPLHVIRSMLTMPTAIASSPDWGDVLNPSKS